MAFDRTNPTDLAALKSEVNTDPIAMGYNATGPTDAILALLNDPLSNVGLETGTPPLTLGDFFDILARETATSTQFEFNAANIFAMAGSEGPETDISDFRDAILNGAGMGDNQVNAAINALSRRLSRGEVLFGGTDGNGTAEFVTITRDDWIAARDS